jgi:hypothetical protein
VTRWSSKYDMAKRYIELEPHIKNIREIEDMLLTNCRCQDLTNLVIDHSKFQSITTRLQAQGCSPLTICKVFDTIIESDMDYHLAPTSVIVNTQDCESGLVTVLVRNHLSLTSREKQRISNILKTSSSLPSQGIGISTPQMVYFEELQEQSVVASAMNKINSLIVHFVNGSFKQC